jgi:hypothetical protein
VLLAAKERAVREKRTTGEVISDLARRGLTEIPEQPVGRKPKPLRGFRPFPKRGTIVTNALIDRLGEDDAH